MRLMDKPSDETIRQIDFVIQGLENGKYKELAKEVEFHQKLKGEDDPNYFQSLIFALEAAQLDITKLEQRIDQQRMELNTTQSDVQSERYKVQTLEEDVKVLGKAVKYLMQPDPLGNSYDLQEINSWLANKSIY